MEPLSTDASDYHTLLSRTFWIVVVIHMITFAVLQVLCQPFSVEKPFSLREIASPLAVLPFGGIGTLAVWFAWTNRPAGERVTRAIVAVASVVGAVYLTKDSRLVRHDWMLEAPFLLLGALAVSLPVSWFGNITISPPGNRPKPTRLSIKNVLAATLCVAAWLAIVKVVVESNASKSDEPELLLRTAWLDSVSLTLVGAVMGLVTSFSAWFVFQVSDRTVVRSLMVLFAVILYGLISGDHQSIAQRLVALFVSPALTFATLKRVGYRRPQLSGT